MSLLPLCKLHLALPLRRNQIHAFRGAVAEAVGLENDLFHNHSDDPEQPLHYRYPLIQYKVLHGQALIVGLGKGASALRSFVEEDGLLLAGKFRIQQRVDENFQLGMTEEMRPYYLEQWLALNQVNYGRWMEMEHPISRKMELERILAAHILSFAAGVGFTVPRPRGLVVELHEAAPPRRVRCHDGQLISFDVRFSANINLPFDVDIGKSASHGFGCVWHDHKAERMEGRKATKAAFEWEW